MAYLLRAKTGCKVNLSLRITGIRCDGWHELDTLFIPLEMPCDELEISFDEAIHEILVSCDEAGIDPYKNTLTKAYTCFAEQTGYRPGVQIRLKKGIPHGAGLGGGSADAAVVLLRLNERLTEPLPLPELTRIAAQVGADVPFFLQNVPCQAQGIGDILVPLHLPILGGAFQGNRLLLLCPSIRVATPWAYQAWDAFQSRRNDSEKKRLTENTCRDKEMLSQALQRGNIPTTPQGASVFWLENSFEVPVFAEWPRLRELKEELLRHGARAAVMSGSGAALVGVFRTEDEMQQFMSGFRDQDVTVYCHAL